MEANPMEGNSEKVMGRTISDMIVPFGTHGGKQGINSRTR